MINKMKKGLAAMMTGTFILSLLTGCGSGKTNDAEWKEAYLNYIQTDYSQHPDVGDWTGSLQGTFIYLDDDAIPEMLLEVPFTSEVIVTYRDGKVVAYNEPDATVFSCEVVSYIEYEGSFLYKGVWNTGETDTLVKLSGGVFQEIAVGDITTTDEDFNPISESKRPCLWNGTEVVGITDYENAMSADYDLSQTTQPVLDMTYSDIEAYLTSND